MKLLISFLLFTTLSFGQNTIYTITKKDGTEYKTKNYFTKNKTLKLNLLDSNNSVEIPYNLLNSIKYTSKRRKNKGEIITLKFVRISKRNGRIMELLNFGKCEVYEYRDYSNVGISVNFYVLRENENIATWLGSKDLVSVMNFKKRALEYFKDCPTVLKKIKKKFKRKKIPKLIEFYNKNCL